MKDDLFGEDGTERFNIASILDFGEENKHCLGRERHKT